MGTIFLRRILKMPLLRDECCLVFLEHTYHYAVTKQAVLSLARVLELTSSGCVLQYEAHYYFSVIPETLQVS